MALQSTYEQFLAAPNPALLASNASLHYITTLTTISGPAAIVKHLNSQAHELKKEEEKFLSVVEGPDALAAEVHTTVEFVTGGGAYLPALDDNFLADRVVNFPIIHIVSFDASGKIQQIRQSWDQGSLLKLIDVIGRTGRNWPIRDGKDQIKLIAASVKLAAKAPAGPATAGDDEDHIARSRGNSNNVTRDPHASLSLFAPREKTEVDSLPAVVAPRTSAKPPPRDYHDLFVGQESGQASSSGTVDREHSESPAKPIAAKSGAAAGKNYRPSRLFEADEEVDPSVDRPAEHLHQANSKKYQHFDFADGSDPQDIPRPTPLKERKTKHGSQWNFEDFSTPQKVVPSKVLRTQEVRHWGTSDDEVVDSPVKVKKVDKPRKDAETHFEFVDDGTPEGRRLVSRPRGGGANTGMGLYKDNLFEEGGAEAVADAKAAVANVKDRRKDFDSQFIMADESPAGKPVPPRISEDRAKAVKMMDANWSYDELPNQKENLPASSARADTSKGPLADATNQNNLSTGISVAGDGMGNRKVGLENRDHQQKGIATGGDGMGGKKGTSRQWGFGDESDGEEAGGPNVLGKYKTGKTQGKAQASGGDFWDF